MKKFYTLILSLAVCCFTASAADWDIVLNVIEGAERVKAVVGENADDTDVQVIELVNGENKIHIPSYEALYFIPYNESDIVILKDSTGETITKSMWDKYFQIYASGWDSPSDPYSLSVIDENIYRSKSVTVNMDNCSKVTIKRADGKEFKPDQNTISIPYNPEEEADLIIKTRTYSDLIYKVNVGDKEISKLSDGYYLINLTDNTDDSPMYVEQIDVTADFPEGMKFKTTLSLNGPTEMIKYIRINDKDVDNLAACLTDAGFEADPADKIAIGFDGDHKIDELIDNGAKRNAFSQHTIEMIDCDHNIEITGHKYSTFNVKFNTIGADGITAMLGNSRLRLEEGTSIVEFSEKNSYVVFSEAKGYEFETFTDASSKDYLSTSDWNRYRNLYLTLKEGDEYTIVTSEIRRDNQLAIYFSDFSALSFGNFRTYFDKYEELPQPQNGYNLINFRDEDGSFNVYASGEYSGFYAYKNGEFIEPDYEGAKYFEDANVAHNDVYKVFFMEEPTVYDVTFTVSDNALDGYKVKKDVITDVDYTAPVKAVGNTLFTISPTDSENGSIVVSVGMDIIEPENGVYTFETNTDTNVSVTSTSGIEAIQADRNTKSDVYNLQGICVGRRMSADKINSLPSGIYIVNGTKTVIR